MRTITVINQRGRTGKTTTCVNLAATLGEQRRDVLLIDIDPQHSSTTWYLPAGTAQGGLARKEEARHPRTFRAAGCKVTVENRRGIDTPLALAALRKTLSRLESELQGEAA